MNVFEKKRAGTDFDPLNNKAGGIFTHQSYLWYIAAVMPMDTPARRTAIWSVGFWLLAGCATSGPDLHTASDRAVYAQMAPAVREMVDKGQINKGMDPDSVKISWGRPSAINRSESNPLKIEWIYYGFRWEDVPNWVYVFDRYGGWRLEFQMERRALPYVRGKVEFENGRVAEWHTFPPSGPK
jgi:hypothetical protein